MTNFPLPTEFAPAERASVEEVQKSWAIFQGKQLLNQFIDATPNIVMVLNQQRQVIYANKRLIDFLNSTNELCFLGYRPGEILNCLHARQSAGGCGTTEYCSQCGAVAAILNSQRGLDDVQECRISRENGDALDLRVWATPLIQDGEAYTILSVADISDEKRRRALERIFFHDILNTAGGVYGFSQLLKAAPPDEIPTYAATLFTLSESLIQEISAQRELSIAENNELVIHLAFIRSRQLLEEVAALFCHHEVATGKYLEIDPQSSDTVFTSDEVLLKRVIGNMVKNALEASGAEETVTLGCQAEPASIIFWVNNPAFMPRNVQLQIFQRSYTTKGSGRGLGTYSIKLLGERYLKGQVSFSSTPIYGTTFRIRLPLA